MRGRAEYPPMVSGMLLSWFYSVRNERTRRFSRRANLSMEKKAKICNDLG